MNKVYLNIFFMRIAPITTDFKNGYVGLAPVLPECPF